MIIKLDRFSLTHVKAMLSRVRKTDYQGKGKSIQDATQPSLVPQRPRSKIVLLKNIMYIIYRMVG